MRLVGGAEIREDFPEEEAPELVLKEWQELAESTKLCQGRRGSLCNCGAMSSLGWLESGVEGWFPELGGGRVGLIRLNLQLVAW